MKTLFLCDLCMNDCTLPIHLNSILHITSTLIWAIKCAVCIVLFFLWLPLTGMPTDPWTSSVSLQRQKPILLLKCPKRWSASYNDCNRWKCFTTHFRSFVVINKVALKLWSVIAFRPLLSIYLFKWQVQFMERRKVLHSYVPACKTLIMLLACWDKHLTKNFPINWWRRTTGVKHQIYKGRMTQLL